MHEVVGSLVVELEDESVAVALYKSLLPEARRPPSYRSRVVLKLERGRVVVEIRSRDLTSFRAAFNGFARLIHAALSSLDSAAGSRRSFYRGASPVIP